MEILAELYLHEIKKLLTEFEEACTISTSQLSMFKAFAFESFGFVCF